VQDGVDYTKIEGLKHKLEKGGTAIQRNDYKKTAFFETSGSRLCRIETTPGGFKRLENPTGNG